MPPENRTDLEKGKLWGYLDKVGNAMRWNPFKVRGGRSGREHVLCYGPSAKHTMRGTDGCGSKHRDQGERQTTRHRAREWAQ